MESFEERQESVINYAKKLGVKYKVYPCGHVCVPATGVECPEKCPFSHDKNGRAINP